jgi:tetratricopeptide (TPR) repeat protein
VAVGTDLVKTHGDRRECRRVLGIAQLNRGVLREKLGKREEAEADLRAAAETIKPLADAKPAIVEDVINLGNAYYKLAQLHFRRDRKSTASTELEQAIAYHKRAGSNPSLWLDYKLKFTRLKLRTDEAALKEANEAEAIGSSLVKDHADRRECLSILATALTGRAVILDATGQPAKAEEDLLRARDHLKPLVGEAGSNPNPDDAKDLGLVHYNLARVRSRLGHQDEAMADLDEAIALHERSGVTPSTDAPIPPLWYDLDLKANFLARRKPRDFLGEANAAERLPALQPADPDSAIRAARALGACTFAKAYAGKPDDPAVLAQIQDYSDRTLKVLQTAAERGLIGVKELDEPFYKKVSSRADFGKIRELLQKKGL